VGEHSGNEPLYPEARVYSKGKQIIGFLFLADPATSDSPNVPSGTFDGLKQRTPKTDHAETAYTWQRHTLGQINLEKKAEPVTGSAFCPYMLWLSIRFVC